jgi:hypothetical protein
LIFDHCRYLPENAANAPAKLRALSENEASRQLQPVVSHQNIISLVSVEVAVVVPGACAVAVLVENHPYKLFQAESGVVLEERWAFYQSLFPSE